jgi:hypothetical protein
MTLGMTSHPAGRAGAQKERRRTLSGLAAAFALVSAFPRTYPCILPSTPQFYSLFSAGP